MLDHQFHDAVNQPWFIIRHPRPMPLRRPHLPQHPTRPPLGDAQPLVDPVHRLPALWRAQKFPEATSLRIALPNAWSATSYLSRVFSRSSSWSRLAWSSRKLPSVPPRHLTVDQLGVLDLIISETGEVEHVKLISIANRFQERMIVAAAKAWRFRPALKDGQPVKYRIRVRVTL